MGAFPSGPRAMSQTNKGSSKLHYEFTCRQFNTRPCWSAWTFSDSCLQTNWRALLFETRRIQDYEPYRKIYCWYAEINMDLVLTTSGQQSRPTSPSPFLNKKATDSEFRHPLSQAFQSEMIAVGYQSHIFLLMRIWPGFILPLEKFGLNQEWGGGGITK